LTQVFLCTTTAYEQIEMTATTSANDITAIVTITLLFATCNTTEPLQGALKTSALAALVLALSHTDPQGAATRFEELLTAGGTVGGLDLQGEHDVQELEDVQLPLSGRCKKWLAAAGGTDARSAARKAANADPVSTLLLLMFLVMVLYF
jgi:hypothetical protein